MYIGTATLADASSTDLSPAQLARLNRALSRFESYLSKLTGRMAQKHFPHDDPLRVAAERAFATVATLAQEIDRLARQRQK